MSEVAEIVLKLSHIKDDLELRIDPRGNALLFDEESSAEENNEARYQLVEGCYYDYELSLPEYELGSVGENIIQPRKRNSSYGTISPNIFVGTLSIPILLKESKTKVGEVKLEVQSIKSNYRQDYRDMLELITEKCTSLLMQSNSPVSHSFEIDYENSYDTLYQKFAFINSVVSSDDFKDAVHRIITSPVTTWKETEELKDVRAVKRFTNRNVKELLKGGNRTELPSNHFFRSYGLRSLPEKISSVKKEDTVDTPENRFIKHALDTFLKFATDVNNVAKAESKLYNESMLLISQLESELSHSVWKEVSRPQTLKLNSPVLQRKEGYREVLRTWLMFDLAAKLIWEGGEDVYGAGKKDIAILYEYWLFFKLLDLFQEIFLIDPKDISQLIEKSDNDLNLRLKQGKFTALRGVYQTDNRKLNIRFNYNRSFSGRKKYPDSGSWTTTMRPDYTLSFWPFGLKEDEAEEEELIVHVHFDAKYKIANLANLIESKSNEELDEEKEDNRKGIYKNADLLKMHAYKDAIRRTGGAYVLYPGEKKLNRKGFHEIIPGLGAFPVKPSKTNSGIGELKAFILEIIDHFIDRNTQRERIAYRTYDIHQDRPDENNKVNELLPEPYGDNRGLLPSETFVLVGYYREDKLLWILQNKLYNARANSKNGSLHLGLGESTAKYILLHTSGETTSNKLLRITSTGPRVFSKEQLIIKGYQNPTSELYLVYDVEELSEDEIPKHYYDITRLDTYRKGRASALPFTVTLAELMKCKV